MPTIYMIAGNTGGQVLPFILMVLDSFRPPLSLPYAQTSSETDPEISDHHLCALLTTSSTATPFRHNGMSARQEDDSRVPETALPSQTSPVPVLGEGLSPTSYSGLPEQGTEKSSAETEQDPKASKRRFWNLGRKKDEKSSKKDGGDAPSSMPFRSASPIPVGNQRVSSPQLQQAFAPASPGRNVRSSSPQLLSPASSSIFERNVQEDVVVTASSPAIPSHITTENYIPPVLDASSKAITDDHLDPDSVEIVTHAAHQPAAVTVATGTAHSQDTPMSPLSEDLGDLPTPAPAKENEDAASTYGDLDTADVRRLSFISFADVVNAEHAVAGDHNSVRDSLLLSGASSVASPLPAARRSPSPIRSPISPPLSASMSGSPNLHGADASPGRAPKVASGSPSVSGLKGASPPPVAVGGELAIEPMTQALRKTGSGDLSGYKSPGSAPSEDVKMEG